MHGEKARERKSQAPAVQWTTEKDSQITEDTSCLWTCESEIFRINRYDLNSNLESKQGVVIYMFNAVCHRSCVGLLCTTGNYHTACYVVM